MLHNRTGAWKPNALACGALFLVIILSIAAPAIFLPIAIAAFLYIVPGYLFLSLLRLELTALETAAFSLLASIMASSYLIYWLSLALGYSVMTFYFFFSVCALAALFLPPFPRVAALPRLSRTDAIALAVSGACALIFFSILYASLWVPTETGVIVAGANYGDYFLHASVIESVNHGNFPPQEPIFAGFPLAYHWFIDLHTAIAAKLLGSAPRIPAIVDSSLSVGLISLFVFLLSLRFTENRKAAALAAVLVIFAGSFAWLKFADALGTAPLPALLKGNGFDNDWRYFQLPSMLPGFLLPQRPLAIGLAAFAGILLLISHAYPSDWRKLVFAGILLGMLPPFHYYAFLAAALCTALYFAIHSSAPIIRACRNAAANRARLSALALAVRAPLIVVIVSLAFAFPFLLGAAGRASGMLQPLPGWVAPNVFKSLGIIPENGPVDLASAAIEFVKFYAANFGFVPLLAVPGAALLLFALSKKEPAVRACGMAGISFLLLSAALLFALPNLFTLSNTDWDMGKFFMLMMVPLSILAASFVARLPDWALPAALIIICFTPLLSSIFYVTCGWEGLSSAELAAGEWISNSAPPLSVFASSSDHNTPIDSVAGRLRILGYQSWVNNYGLDYDSRKADLTKLYCGPRGGASALMQKYGATFAYVSWKEEKEYACAPQFGEEDGFSLAYNSSGIRIYKFKAP